MSIDLTPEQQDVLQHAIRCGWVRSVDEFIDSAIASLQRRETTFDGAKAAAAAASIREIRKGVQLELDGLSFRGLAHTGHRY